jgi:hypothetical protein
MGSAEPLKNLRVKANTNRRVNINFALIFYTENALDPR